MNLPGKVTLCSCLLLLVLAAPPFAAETYWTIGGESLTAFTLDFETGASHLAMQGVGVPDHRVGYVSAATDPLTGTLWVTYIDRTLGRWLLGRLPVGTALPQQEFAFPENGYWPGRFAEFSPTGILYLQVFEQIGASSIRQHLATIDPATGELQILLTFGPEDYFSGLSFHPLDGKLYLSGREDCPATCIFYLDTLTVPQHQRARVWQSASYEIGDPLFDVSGDMAILSYSFFRTAGDTLQWIGDPPRYATPFGPQFFWAIGASPARGTEGCVPSASRACLRHRRFAIDATYDASIFGGRAGDASPQLESDESLKFSFFQPENLELLLKIVDGCTYNGHFWVYFSGLTNVGVSLRITDTITGAVFDANNPPGTALAPVIDIQALACTL